MTHDQQQTCTQCGCNNNNVQDMYHMCCECEHTQKRVQEILDQTQRRCESNRNQYRKYMLLTRTQQIYVSLGGAENTTTREIMRLSRKQLQMSWSAWTKLYFYINDLMDKRCISGGK